MSEADDARRAKFERDLQATQRAEAAVRRTEVRNTGMLRKIIAKNQKASNNKK
jgi:hypothetical protein